IPHVSLALGGRWRLLLERNLRFGGTRWPRERRRGGDGPRGQRRRAWGRQRLPGYLLELDIDELLVVAVAVGSRCHPCLASRIIATHGSSCQWTRACRRRHDSFWQGVLPT